MSITMKILCVFLLLCMIVMVIVYAIATVPLILDKRNKTPCYYIFDPKEDLSAYELAKILPYIKYPNVLYVSKWSKEELPKIESTYFFPNIKRHFKESEGCLESQR